MENKIKLNKNNDEENISDNHRKHIMGFRDNCYGYSYVGNYPNFLIK